MVLEMQLESIKKEFYRLFNQQLLIMNHLHQIEVQFGRVKNELCWKNADKPDRAWNWIVNS